MNVRNIVAAILTDKNFSGHWWTAQWVYEDKTIDWPALWSRYDMLSSGEQAVLTLCRSLYELPEKVSVNTFRIVAFALIDEVRSIPWATPEGSV